MGELVQLIGNRIKTLRTARLLTQEELAEKAGLHFSYVGGLERGERNASLGSLEKIIVALGVSFEEFFQLGSHEIESEKNVLGEYYSLLIEKEAKSIHKSVKKILDVYKSLDKN